MSEDERAQLYIALSELWSDRELTDEDTDRIARVLRASGMEREEAEEIFRRELAPVLDPNLRSVAGEWAGFDPDWLFSEVRGGRERRGWLRRLLARTNSWRSPARSDWERVLDRAYGADGA